MQKQTLHVNVPVWPSFGMTYWINFFPFFSLFSVLHHQLEVELERVTRERDQLANQLREDAQFLDNKITFARQQG